MKLPGFLVSLLTFILGNHATDHLAARVEAAVATALAANAALGRDAAIQFAVTQADRLIAPILRLPVFSLAHALGMDVEPILNAKLEALAGDAYDKIVAAVAKAAGGLAPAPTTTVQGGGVPV